MGGTVTSLRSQGTAKEDVMSLKLAARRGFLKVEGKGFDSAAVDLRSTDNTSIIPPDTGRAGEHCSSNYERSAVELASPVIARGCTLCPRCNKDMENAPSVPCHCYASATGR